jgi:hypothetical protein
MCRKTTEEPVKGRLSDQGFEVVGMHARWAWVIRNWTCLWERRQQLERTTIHTGDSSQTKTAELIQALLEACQVAASRSSYASTCMMEEVPATQYGVFASADTTASCDRWLFFGVS